MRDVERRMEVEENIAELTQRFPYLVTWERDENLQLKPIADYRKLVVYYWKYYDNLPIYIPPTDFPKLHSPESITRAFRKAREENKIRM